MFVRRDIYKLLTTGPEVASLRRGVTQMQTKAVTDPTGWVYQANMHGTATVPADPHWNGCQHGSFLFLSWHRMYLYYFERILRKASGDPTFALPYWNYTKAEQNLLPEVFRLPGDDTNSLFTPERSPDINAGHGLRPSDVDYERAYRFTNFLSPPGSGASFGGMRVTAPMHFPMEMNGQRIFGQLENQPHNQIHTQVGGRTGLMSDANSAARDPIFWLHHANIDRLWQGWLNRGPVRVNPTTNSFWMTYKFHFFDEDGIEVTMSGADVLDMTAQLGYQYEELPGPSPLAANFQLFGGQIAMQESQPVRLSLTAQSPSGVVSLGAERMSVPVLISSLEEARHAHPLFAQQTVVPAHRIIMRLEGIDYDTNPGHTYEIYLNLPKGQDPEYTDFHYVGNLGFFAMDSEPHRMGDTMPMGHSHRRHRMKGVVSFDITDVVGALQESGHWNPEAMDVTFVLSGLLPPPGSSAPITTVESGERARIDRIVIASE